MLPDQLQSKQVVLDSIEQVFISKKDQIERLLTGEEFSISECREKFRMSFIKTAYQLCLKRFEQLVPSSNGGRFPFDGSTDKSFYSLPIVDRAVIFMKTKMKLEIHYIEMLTELSRYEVMTILSRARENLLADYHSRGSI